MPTSAGNAPRQGQVADAVDVLDQVSTGEVLMLSVEDVEHISAIVNLQADVDTWRELTKSAIESLHDVTVDRDQLRARYHAALEQLRDLRGQAAHGAVRRAA